MFKSKLQEYNMYKLQNRVSEFNGDTIFRADISLAYKEQLEKEQRERQEQLEKEEQIKLLQL